MIGGHLRLTAHHTQWERRWAAAIVNVFHRERVRTSSTGFIYSMGITSLHGEGLGV